MNIEISELVYNVDTRETETITKTYELVESPKPPEREGYHYEEWLERTETQLIQHWDEIQDEVSSDEILSIILGEGGA